MVNVLKFWLKENIFENLFINLNTSHSEYHYKCEYSQTKTNSQFGEGISRKFMRVWLKTKQVRKDGIEPSRPLRFAPNEENAEKIGDPS